MSIIFKKTLLKWSALAVLGLGAYFVGYFWGAQRIPAEVAETSAAPVSSEKTANFGKLK